MGKGSIVVVTGGAGFIGSNVVAALTRRDERVAVCDWLGSEDKWQNIAKHDLYDLIIPDQLGAWLDRNSSAIKSVIHMGGITSTAENNADLILRSNFQLSLELWSKCTQFDWPFIYASSAATYGDGANGFDDTFTAEALSRLRPLNAYGWSKHAFDRRVCRAINEGERAPPKWAGLKFFNVYGPNEYHKRHMRSIIAKNYKRVVAGDSVQLFRSYHATYPDGEQRRDFIYVRDCVCVVLWMLDNSFPSSIYNVGSGIARTWLDAARTVFVAVQKPERIEFIELPEELRANYQYFTQARLDKLRSAGYHCSMTPLDEGITHYVESYLSTSDIYA